MRKYRMSEAAARSLAAAQDVYDIAWMTMMTGFRNPVDPDKNRFWEFVDLLKSLVAERKKFRGSLSLALPFAVDELMRRSQAKDFQGGMVYSFDECIDFACRWAELVSVLYTPLFDVVENKGDDGYGDFLDSLPFAGKSFVDSALAGDFTSSSDLRSELLAALGGDPYWFRFVYEGENYVRMKLDDEAKRRYVFEVLDSDSRPVA